MAIVSKATQEFIPIKEIRDGVVILKDNSLHIILMASTLNFALKSEDEQTAILMQYQNFLNSLDFSVQFFVESRKLNIGPYIATLKNAEEEQVNELLKIQTREYIEFVKNFVKSTNIVAKTFYVTVAYNPSVFGINKGFLGDIGKKFISKSNGAPGERFEEHVLQLQQRASVVQQGLAGAGVRTVTLNTEELIELFYKLFNPGELEKEIK
jgi:type IV secretory pathway VirB4 component